MSASGGDLQVSKARRRQVTAACISCRRRKNKCDGSRPCAECSRRSEECVYASQENETPQQAVKRKYDEISQLYDSLASQDETQALETFRRIRAGDRLDSILKYVRQRDVTESNPEHRRQRDFLIALVQSTGSLHEVVKFAAWILLDPVAVSKLPSSSEYAVLRTCVVNLESLSAFLSKGPRALESPEALDGFSDGPLKWVPAAPWTTITNSDDAVSHLVSVYLAFVNPYHRYLEQDMFLRGMRSRTSSHAYCSAVLVNAVLATGSLYSEIDEAYATPGQPLSRGEHFYKEAVRLWTLEQGRPSITNIQASMLLGFYQSMLGKDKIGLDWAIKAAELNKALPQPQSDPSIDEDVTASRVRSCLAASVVCLNLIFALGLLKDTTKALLEDAPSSLAEILPDTVVYWEPFPLIRTPFPFRINLLMRERCRLVQFIAELRAPEDTSQSRAQMLASAQSLARRMHQWYQALSSDLQYRKFIPAPLMEFHLHYWTMHITLYQQTIERLQRPNTESTDRDPMDIEDCIRAYRKGSLHYSHQIAACLADFREIYGFKIIPSYQVQGATVAIMVLLRALKPPSPSLPERLLEIGGESSHIESSFEECFRCLMAAGLQQMLPRMISRMVCQSAAQMKVPFPSAVQQMLELATEAVWQPSDLRRLSSEYPDWGLGTQTPGKMRSMESMLRRLELQEKPSEGEDSVAGAARARDD